MGLERDDDVILRAEFLRIVGAVQMLDAFLAIDEQLKAVLLHRFEMGAASDEADFSAGLSELNAHIAADCARAVDADLHCPLLVGPASCGTRIMTGANFNRGERRGALQTFGVAGMMLGTARDAKS